jgi:hypothetical protein
MGLSADMDTAGIARAAARNSARNLLLNMIVPLL